MIGYFDLMRRKPADQVARLEVAPSSGEPLVRQGVIYLSLVVGILVVPLIKDLTLSVGDAFSLRNIIIAGVTGIALFPAAYRNAFDPNAPLLSQAGLSVMAGFGWENVVHTAIKASGH